MLGYLEQDSIRVLLVDEECLVRASVAALLSSWNGFQIIGEAETKDDTLTQCRLHEPDVILLSLAGSEEIDSEVAHEVARACGGSRVIVLVGQCTDDFVFRLMQCGVARILAKGDQPTKLKEAIQGVYSRHTNGDRTLKRTLVEPNN